MSHRKKEFFQGWYFKHQQGKDTVAFIPGVCRERNGQSHAFIQVITNDHSYQATFPASQMICCQNHFGVKIDANVFTHKGIVLNIDREGLLVQGRIRYDGLTPLKRDIMGPFARLPFMECHHEVISMRHKLDGKVRVNGQEFVFTNGIGYIEGDKGHSFPKNYAWFQCNQFDTLKDCSVMAAVADIPFCGFHFQGCICSLLWQGQEFRLATYCGARMVRKDSNGLVVKQGKCLLEIMIVEGEGQKLLAPSRGSMSRTIHESPCREAEVRFSMDNKTIFQGKTQMASWEFVE